MKALSKTFLGKLFSLGAKGYNKVQEENIEKLKQEKELRKKIFEEMQAENPTENINTTTPTIIITIIIIILVILVLYYV